MKNWMSGDPVRIERAGRLYRHGRIEVAMADGSGFWVCADGAQPRELIWIEEGFSVRSIDEGTFAKRITSDKLFQK